VVLEETVKRSVENTNISSSTPIMQPNTPVCTCQHMREYNWKCPSRLNMLPLRELW